MKLLTIVVPCYNSQDYMEKCIESLRPADERLEIIIIDDGSKDRTGEIADALAKKYPETIKAVHQPNGGHGEGINHGLREASGRYFKTVDSDDVLSEDFGRFLDLLEKCDAEGGVDLFVNDYRYVHADGKGDRTIDFSNYLPENRIFGWPEVHSFHVDQVLMIHTCTFRTEMLREAGIVLPQHMFYEDNYYVYANLVNVKRIYYMHAPLYLYTIGREGQSVQFDVITRRYKHQIKAAELCFTACDLNKLDNPKLRRYLEHELFIMCGGAALYSRINSSDEAWEDLKAMWEKCDNFDYKLSRRLRKRTMINLLQVPGKAGSGSVRVLYTVAHRIVRFN